MRFYKKIKLKKHKELSKKNEIKLKNYSYNIGFFSILFEERKMWVRLMICFFAGLLSSFNSVLLIQNTGLYTAGISGIFQGIARIVDSLASISEELKSFVFNLIYYGGYFFVNVPLLIFAYFKIGRKFAILSIVYLLSATFFPFLWNLIPNIGNLFIFGDVTSSIEVLDQNNVQILFFNGLKNGGLNDVGKFSIFLLYGLVSGFFQGLTYALVLLVGGSTAGNDVFAFFYSFKKGKSISLVLFYVNLFFLSLSIIVGGYVPAGLLLVSEQSTNYLAFSFYSFFSQNLVVSLLILVISSLTYGYFFPKNKFVKVVVYSNMISQIRDNLYNSDFLHGSTIIKVIGGYSLKDKEQFEFISYYMFLPKIIKKIRQTDPDSIISIYKILGIYGKMYDNDNIN